MRKRKSTAPADPEFIAHVAEAERRYHEAHAGRVGDGRVQGEISGPAPHVFDAVRGMATGIPESPLHRHDDDCWTGAPYRIEILGASWWMRHCRVAGEIGLRPVTADDPAELPEASWWTQVGR